jgi:hypothetical protein
LYHKTFSNLISGQLFKQHEIEATENKATIRVGGKIIYEADRMNGKMWIVPDEMVAKTVQNEGLKDIHERYGHVSLELLTSLPEIAGKFTPKSIYCEACEQGKSQKPAARSHGTIRTTDILERIHADLVGPINPESRGCQYLLVVTDDYSCYIIAQPN